MWLARFYGGVYENSPWPMRMLCDNSLGIFLLFKSQIRPRRFCFIQANNSAANDVISWFNFKSYGKRQHTIRQAGFFIFFILPERLVCCGAVWGNSSLHLLFWMTAQCLRASQEGQGVFSQQRPPHIHALVRGKQGDKRFSLPRSISAPAYRSNMRAW